MDQVGRQNGRRGIVGAVGQRPCAPASKLVCSSAPPFAAVTARSGDGPGTGEGGELRGNWTPVALPDGGPKTCRRGWTSVDLNLSATPRPLATAIRTFFCLPPTRADTAGCQRNAGRDIGRGPSGSRLPGRSSPPDHDRHHAEREQAANKHGRGNGSHGIDVRVSGRQLDGVDVGRDESSFRRG